MNNKNVKKIFVGISGGVDSSVAAYLLQKEGHEVHGVFIKTWAPDWLPCTWVDEKRDAMRVCAKLGIPFHFLDAEEEYKKGVADYMISEYKAGRTPNPDVMCNRIIKFGALWDFALAKGADAIATGHYAKTDNKSIFKGHDKSKDQSYFLWMVKNDELKHIYFPIGDLEKKDVRKIAEDADLFTATKKDSQGICFLGDVDMREFLGHYIENKVGNVVDEDGNILGSHDGVCFYTLGERHGFRIDAKTTDQSPYYIVAKDIEQNLLIVSKSPKNSGVKNNVQKIILRDSNWIENFSTDKKYTAHIRYHGADIDAKILSENEVELRHDGLVAEGQSLVLYEGNKMIGGGIVERII